MNRSASCEIKQRGQLSLKDNKLTGITTCGNVEKIQAVAFILKKYFK